MKNFLKELADKFCLDNLMSAAVSDNAADRGVAVDLESRLRVCVMSNTKNPDFPDKVVGVDGTYIWLGTLDGKYYILGLDPSIPTKEEVYCTSDVRRVEYDNDHGYYKVTTANGVAYISVRDTAPTMK